MVAEGGGFHAGSKRVSEPASTCACAVRTFRCSAFFSNMEFRAARLAVLQLLRTVAPADLPALLQWMRTTRKRSEPESDSWGKDMRWALTLGT